MLCAIIAAIIASTDQSSKRTSLLTAADPEQYIRLIGGLTLKDRMQAVMYMGKERLCVDSVEIPCPSAGEALVRVEYAGICGTDLSILSGKHPRARPPLIMGHEFSGRIAEVRESESGEAADGWEIGDLVVAEPLISCGKCFACRSGYAYVCERLGLYGIDAPGAFAEYVSVPLAKLHRIPERIPVRIAALIEPVAVAVHAVRLSALKTGDTVCVQGAGPIGLLTALVASLSGAGRVIITEKEPLRVRIAGGFGLRAVDLAKEDPLDVVMRETGGRGADVVFEAAGSPRSVLLLPKLCRVKGEIVMVAMPKDPREVDIVGLTFKELTLKGVRVYAPYDFERAIDLVGRAGWDLEPLLSEPYGFAAAEEAFRRAAEGRQVMRVIFQGGKREGVKRG
jgi:(R,R)-butanediol dehydrogenase/meso-butanediol dehydrogenase/diacetyl reductase